MCDAQQVPYYDWLTGQRPSTQVQDVHMLTHQDTGKLRGCFVAFATPEEVGLAVARDGSVSRPCFSGAVRSCAEQSAHRIAQGNLWGQPFSELLAKACEWCTVVLGGLF